MTVSSVKNLNGETFSAVQDASLTDIVSSNSANWNEISAYQANSASYLQDTDLTIVDNKITEISGVPISAGGGGDVPEGVMSESGLEYNAVNEISGYNGSAIAQYGAEKQWLVHDDTIVHVSNSAQYAFGVNLSAISGVLAQMMGIDETVLYDGVRTQSANLNDSIWNYKRLGIYMGANGQNYANYQVFDTNDVSANGNIIMTQNTFNFEGTTYYSFVANYSALNNGSALYSDGSYGLSTTTGTSYFRNNKNLGCIKRVIGIGRKEV